MCIIKINSVAPIQQFAYMPIFHDQIAYMQIRSDIVCVKYIVVVYNYSHMV